MFALKRILLVAMLAIFLLSACTNNNNQTAIIDTIPSTEPLTSTQPTASSVLVDNVIDTNENTETLTNEEEALIFLNRAIALVEKLDSLSYSTMDLEISYFETDDPEDPEIAGYSHEIMQILDGTIKRNPKVAYVKDSFTRSSGYITNTGEYVPEQFSWEGYNYEHIDYYDEALGRFSHSIDPTDDYIYYSELDHTFDPFGDLQALLNLFLAYPDKLTIYEDNSFEEQQEKLWTIELKLSNEQFLEEMPLLDYHFFTGVYWRSEEESNDFHYVEADLMDNLYLAFSFEEDATLRKFTVQHQTNTLQDYVGARDDYFTNYITIDFFDHNEPFTFSIPEDVILNANY